MSLAPDQAVLLLTCGVALVCLELNRPGWIVPGALGLLTVLLAAGALLHAGINALAALLCATSAALLAAGLRCPLFEGAGLKPRHKPGADAGALAPEGTDGSATSTLGSHSVAAAATLTLTLGLVWLNPGIHAMVAVPCGLLIGTGTTLLTRIARRARANKGLD